MQSTRENNAGNGLFPRLSLCHGYLNKRGYCFNGAMHIIIWHMDEGCCSLQAGLKRIRSFNSCMCCSAGDCQVFPVVYGEWGSALKDSRDITVHAMLYLCSVLEAQAGIVCVVTTRDDLVCVTMQWLNDMISYMNNVGTGNDGLHNAIGSWFW
jgi:hypothetical protein